VAAGKALGVAEEGIGMMDVAVFPRVLALLGGLLCVLVFVVLVVVVVVATTRRK
jgi:hypothetical protein